MSDKRITEKAKQKKVKFVKDQEVHLDMEKAKIMAVWNRPGKPQIVKVEILSK